MTNTLYVRCQTKDYILDIVVARAGMRINKINSAKKESVYSMYVKLIEVVVIICDKEIWYSLGLSHIIKRDGIVENYHIK